MKHIIVWILAAMLLILAVGCVPESLAGLVQEPMDASVLDVLDADTQAFFTSFAAHPPASMTIRYDQHYPDAVVTDQAMIKEMVDAVSQMRVSAKTNVASTDGYHRLVFTMADGTDYVIGFENSVLCEGEERYELENAEAFWRLFKSTAEKYYEQSLLDEENSARKLGASLFDFYGDPAIAAFAADFYNDPPQTLTITRNWEESAEETVTDAETIARVFALLKPIVVEEREDVYYTDSDTFLTFAYADGRAFAFAFNYRHLVVNSDAALGFAAYRLSGDEGLWAFLRG